ncbi:acetylornithine deacetylase [Aquicoccus porphyridii]|uniref:Acetylornithine deacetylase n=1 Tax=Aquicoccus porphyridii TaxID=1852029 RepID=A0A5A9ZC06_9RHOB|nr:acetylornithine deacetylase [Aquicoccus porphyridii]KAA0914723.1 acetylornithine deacetylase [Aquicoccus porphyridii]RAI53339.1 acetylornithine deacetylase [Rhodobacteraceae bacterium AsT-22]
MTTRLSPLELMEKLVSFPTVSRDSNLPLVDWVEEYLTGHGIVCHRHYREDNEQAALFAHVGPEVEGGVILSGHTDVVPVDGQPWASDPFTVTERDGKYFGRGTCDMKGFDALALWALVEAKYQGVTRPLQIALSYDEEVGCVGAPPMIRAMQGPIPRASAVIVGEPSEMRAVTGHKGGIGIVTNIVGFEVHSSLMHTGVNAIMEAAKIIDWTNQVNAEEMAREPDELAAMFEPPWTLGHVGTIQGGTANNITAKDCRFTLGYRVVPSQSAEDWRDRYIAKLREVEAEMKKIRPEARIDFEQAFDVPGLVPEEDGAAEALARRLTGDNGTHVVSYGTEAGQFQAAGYSAVICGPGSIEQAHQPDEFISVAQFNAGHDFMKALLRELA